jgi:8-oxo-dGTP diphosphatase
MQAFVVCKVLIVNKKGEVLAIRRSKTDERRPGEWDFPGGWLEEDEDVFEAVVREAKEEVGIDIARPTLVFGHSEMTTLHGSGTWLLFMTHIDDDPKITLSYEHDLHKWIKPTDLLKEITYERQQLMLQYVLKNKLLEN